MAALLSFGEVLIDFIPADSKSSQYLPMAGGAPANVAVAYAKLGGKSYFSGGISKDNFGNFLTTSLATEGVDLSYVEYTETHNTALVLVSLDSEGERSFNFYRHNTADLAMSKSAIDKIDFTQIQTFHFCSNTLTHADLNTTTLHALALARAQGVTISFDVNLRQQLWPELNDLLSRVEVCLAQSDIVKLSKEEADYLANMKGMTYNEYLQHILSLEVRLIVVTDGPNAIQVLTKNDNTLIDVPRITPVDTTAAGDSFIAGFLFALNTSSDKPINDKLASLETIKNSVLFASRCGAYTCQQKGAFAALPSASDLTDALSFDA